MGLEIILGVASLAVGVIQGVNSMNAANTAAVASEHTAQAAQQSADLGQQAADAQKEVNAIQSAQQNNIALEDRRQRIREDRVRRASMMTASENQGGSGSSSESGGLASLAANFGGLLSLQSGTTRANEGMNKYSQQALDYETQARVISERAGVERYRAQAGIQRAEAFNDFLGIFSSSFDTIGTIFQPPRRRTN